MSQRGSDQSANDMFDEAADAGGIPGILSRGIGGILAAVAFIAINIAYTLGDLVILPVGELAQAGAEIVNTLFVEVMSGIVGAGAAETIASLRGDFSFGPFTIIVAVGVLLGTWWIVRQYLFQDETSNIIPGLGYDIPFFGTDEESDE